MELNDILEEIETIQVTIEDRCTSIEASKQIQFELNEVLERAKKTHREIQRLQVTTDPEVDGLLDAVLKAHTNATALVQRIKVQLMEATPQTGNQTQPSGSHEPMDTSTPRVPNNSPVPATQENVDTTPILQALINELSAHFQTIQPKWDLKANAKNPTSESSLTEDEPIVGDAASPQDVDQDHFEDAQENIVGAPGALIELKMDKIQLPTFNGDLTEWIAFRDQYTDLIHKSKKMTKVTKFYQLRSHLTGLARDAIGGFKLSAANYEAAWQVLQKRYDKPDKIIEEYILQFEKLAYLVKPDAQNLITMVNRANQMLRVLPSLGVDVTSWDTWVMFNLKSRLDHQTLRKWMDQVKLRQSVKLDELLDFLELEAAECLPTEAEKSRPKVIPPERKPFKKYPANAMVVTENRCGQCNGEHPIFRCNTFLALTVNDRLKKVRELKVCIQCLKSHISGECKFGPCPTCNKNHNSLLCFKREKDRKQKKAVVAHASTEPNN